MAGVAVEVPSLRRVGGHDLAVASQAVRAMMQEMSIDLFAGSIPIGTSGFSRLRKVVLGTVSADGSRIAAPVIEIGSMPAPIGHRMVHLVLSDGRELLVSPGHKTSDGRALGLLKIGDELDGSTITRWELVPYAGDRTYDLLPAGATGRYWANGMLLSSTLS